MTQLCSILSVGYVGGSHYTSTGAAVDPLCLPKDPEWGIYRDGVQSFRAYVYGAEYETFEFSDLMTTIAENDIPCAVCLVTNRSVVKMFPGRCDMYNKVFVVKLQYVSDRYFVR